ncbi:MAG: hypothetical protein AB8U25_02785 [Rickettsiales endosymbiont of Dermacentor nuttalli]
MYVDTIAEDIIPFEYNKIVEVLNQTITSLEEGAKTLPVLGFSSKIQN